MSDYIKNQLEESMGEALHEIASAAHKYAALYERRFEQPIGDDYVLGPHVRDIYAAVIGLLNGPTGRLDCGTVDRLVREFAEDASLDGDKL